MSCGQKQQQQQNIRQKKYCSKFNEESKNCLHQKKILKNKGKITQVKCFPALDLCHFQIKKTTHVILLWVHNMVWVEQIQVHSHANTDPVGLTTFLSYSSFP